MMDNKRYIIVALFVNGILLVSLYPILIASVYTGGSIIQIFVAENFLILFVFWFLLFLFFNYFVILKFDKLLKNKILLLLSSFLIFFIILESGLRVFGFKPGERISTYWFKEVDTLINLTGFYADSLGINKVDSISSRHISNSIANRLIQTYDSANLNGALPEVYCLGNDYINLPDNSFRYLLDSINTKSSLADLDSSILNYSKKPINTHGFRSIEFRNYKSSRQKVLLIGDSFTWGNSALYKTNSFADELLALGYIVYNTGITATDPAQYKTVAKHYIPLLKPDVVIVNFFMGNDVVWYKRDVRPFQKALYPTNAGILMACPEGVCFHSSEEAYDYILLSRKIPKHNNGFNYLCSLTAFGSLFWQLLDKWDCVNDLLYDYPEYSNLVEKSIFPYPYCNTEIQEIKKYCEENNAEFILSVFPDIDIYGNWVEPKDIPGLFEGLDYHYRGFQKIEYDLSTNHLNDLGNYNYSRYLDSLLRGN